MLLIMIEQMHKKQFKEWEFKHFFCFVFICLVAFGGGFASVILLIAIFVRELPGYYVVISTCCSVFCIASFAYILCGKDGY